VSVVCNNALNRAVREYKLTDPGMILNKTRELVLEQFEQSEENVMDGMDIALCSLNIETNELLFAGANNPLWIIRGQSPYSYREGDGGRRENPDSLKLNTNNEQLIEIKGDKQPIGKTTVAKPFTTHSVQLYPGDTLYIFTDGYLDQFGGERGKKFRSAKLKQMLVSIQHEAMEQQYKLIDESFALWKGELEQVDDVCVIGVRI
jgi:hypothetical protein